MICKECQEEAKQLSLQANRTLVKCAYCGKEFYRPNSKLENSKDSKDINIKNELKNEISRINANEKELIDELLKLDIDITKIKAKKD